MDRRVEEAEHVAVARGVRHRVALSLDARCAVDETLEWARRAGGPSYAEHAGIYARVARFVSGDIDGRDVAGRMSCAPPLAVPE